MPEFFCGLDAGGTSTRALVANAAGTSFGWGYAGGANPSHEGWQGAGANLHTAMRAACDEAGCRTEAIGSVFLGMASVISASDRESAVGTCRSWNLAPHYRASADHDIRIALEGGLSGRPGIALIAGTGSSCYGRNAEGQSWQSGGWDQLLDDAGSGYDLAQRGMAAACQSADGRLPETVLKQFLFAQLEVENVVDFSVKVHRPKMSRHKIAALAPIVLQAAEDGDEQAATIVVHGAKELARMVGAVTNKLFLTRNPEIVFIGGLLEKSSFYRAKVERAIQAHLPEAKVSATELRPTVGAWSLAASQAGAAVDLPILQKLSQSAKS